MYKPSLFIESGDTRSLKAAEKALRRLDKCVKKGEDTSLEKERLDRFIVWRKSHITKP